MRKNKILIVGFGRMGISHASLIGLYSKNSDIYVWDPNKLLSLIMFVLKPFHSLKLLFNLPKNYKNFTHILVCSPPLFHDAFLQSLNNNFDGKIFIEKPSWVKKQTVNKKIWKNIYVGYVLRQASMVKKLRRKLKDKKISKVLLSMETNFNFDITDGWRAESNQGGIINEYGSHLVNMAIHLAGQKLQVASISIKSKNNVNIILDNDYGAEIIISLIAGSNKVRKTGYKFEVQCERDITFKTDLYEFEEHSNNNYNRITLSEIESKVPMYLRGQEFSNQMVSFFDENDFGNSFIESLITDNILEEIHEEINTRR